MLFYYLWFYCYIKDKIIFIFFKRKFFFKKKESYFLVIKLRRKFNKFIFEDWRKRVINFI